jgi:hypothetical protein
MLKLEITADGEGEFLMLPAMLPIGKYIWIVLYLYPTLCFDFLLWPPPRKQYLAYQ